MARHLCSWVMLAMVSFEATLEVDPSKPDGPAQMHRHIPTVESRIAFTDQAGNWNPLDLQMVP